MILPVVLGIGGNVGFQSKNLSSEAIGITLDIDRRKFLNQWLIEEFKVAAFLSTGIGLVLGIAALFVSAFDLTLAVVVAMASIFSTIFMTLVGLLDSLCFEKLGSAKIPGFSILSDRIGYGLVGTLVYIGVAYLLLPSDLDDMVCPF